MGEWINRPDLQQDWMSLVFLINSIVILALYKLDSSRFMSLINILKPRVYFGKYSHQKELNFFSYFNLLSFVLIVSTLSLTYFSLSNYTGKPLRYSFEFYYLALGLSLVLLARQRLTQFISRQLGFEKHVYLPEYKTFTFATQSSFFIIGLIFIWNYSSLPSLITECLMVLLFFNWILNQCRIFFSFFRSHPEKLIYIILYLCTFKIAPWLWVYFIFIETKL